MDLVLQLEISGLRNARFRRSPLAFSSTEEVWASENLSNSGQNVQQLDAIALPDSFKKSDQPEP